MKKRWITWLVLLAIVVATAVVFVSCDNVEEPSKQTERDTTETGATPETETATEPGIDTKVPDETNDPGVSTDTEETTEAHVHAFGEWTVVKAATCTEGGTEVRTCDCGEREERPLAALGHTIETDPAKIPTCTETGLTEGKHCSVCGKVLVAQEVIPANGHTEVIDPSKAPTCTETGLTEGRHCSVCGEVLVAQKVIPAGHTIVTDPAKSPTCTEAGLTEGKHCSVCGEVLVAQEVVLALGHNFVDEVCTRCGAQYSKGLKFISNGDGTCCVSGIGTCKDTEVWIPPVSPNGDSVTGIGDYAFFGCSSLTSVAIPDSVTSIGVSVFSECSGLTSIRVDENNTVYHSDGNCLIETASKTLVAGCTTSIIPADGSVVSIGVAAFSGCTGLTCIVIPNSVTNIGVTAFFGCTGLTCIVIPNSVTNIGVAAFSGCTGLTSVVIPDSVTSIGVWAFWGCTSLTIKCCAFPQPSGWAFDWNPNSRPVVWGYTGK